MMSETKDNIEIEQDTKETASIVVAPHIFLVRRYRKKTCTGGRLITRKHVASLSAKDHDNAAPGLAQH